MDPRYEMKGRVMLPSRSAPAPPLCGTAQVPKACVSDLCLGTLPCPQLLGSARFHLGMSCGLRDLKETVNIPLLPHPQKFPEQLIRARHLTVLSPVETQIKPGRSRGPKEPCSLDDSSWTLDS